MNFKNEMRFLLHSNNVKTTDKHSSKEERESTKKTTISIFTAQMRVIDHHVQNYRKKRYVCTAYNLEKYIVYPDMYHSGLIAGHIHPALI